MEVEAGAMYQEAANSTANSFAKIPPWFYVILLILGWNELWAILTNPIYLVVAIILGAGIFVVFSLHLEDQALTVSRTVGHETLRVVKLKLDQYMGTEHAEVARKTSTAPADLRRPSHFSEEDKRGSGETRKSSFVPSDDRKASQPFVPADKLKTT